MAENPIRVSILGGGLAGAAILQALLKNPKLDVHIFESAPAFREAGMVIGFNVNAIKALKLMGLQDRLITAKGWQTDGAVGTIAQGQDTGKTCLSLDLTDKDSWGVSRALFLGELLKDIDKSRLHTSKKMKTLTQQEEIVLEFEDGTTHVCDILLGADGIRSAVRKYVVGSDDPSALPTFAGWQTIWTQVPLEAAQRHIGKHLIVKDTTYPVQNAWVGRNTYLLHSSLAKDTSPTVILSRRFDEANFEWKRKTNKAELYDFVKDFEHPIGKATVDLLVEGKEDAEFDMYALEHHSPQASRYVRDGVAIVGDAADATTPWRGSGGAMSLEDALILGACFEKVTDISDAKAALRAYEAVRKPRRSRLVMESYRAGLILSGCDKEIGLDAEKMSKALNDSWDWIYKIDMEQEVKEALQLMEAEKVAGKSEQ